MRMEEENSREAAEKLQQIGSSILGCLLYTSRCV